MIANLFFNSTDIRTALISFIAQFLAVIVVITFHEYAHAFAAVKSGDITPKLYGRYTLNPVAHFDLRGLIMFMLVGFGWAKPVPVNPDNFVHRKRGCIWVAVAGVLTNYIGAFIIYPLYILCVMYMPDILLFDDVLRLFLIYAYMFNLSFFVFNLLPIYPLDGFRLMDSLSRKRGKVYMFLRNYGSFVLLGLVALSFIADLIPALYFLDVLGYFMQFAVGIIGYPISLFWGLFF